MARIIKKEDVKPMLSVFPEIQEEQEKAMKAALYDAMMKFGVKKFESDVLNLTLVAPSNSTAIDSAKLKKKYPAIAAECSKPNPKAGYVKITLKDGGK